MNKIMLIDDSEVVLKSVKRVLSKLPMEVYTFSDPKLALDSIAEIAPQLILLDYNMPEIDGKDFSIKLSEALQIHTTRIYLLSGSDFSETDKFSLMSIGIEKFFKKPPDQELLDEICDFFSLEKSA